MKVLHVLANSFPKINGYAVRSHMLIKAQSRLDGIENVALTSPWYPNIVEMQAEYDLDGVKYLRTSHPKQKKNTKITHKIVSKLAANPITKSNDLPFVARCLRYGSGKLLYLPKICWKLIEEGVLIKHFYQRILQVSNEYKIDLIHAHTPYRVGLPAYKAAKKIGLPFVYEMRGMWEETAVVNRRWKKGGPAYRRFRRKETYLLRKADSVICISEALKNEAISRGVSPNKITVVPNGFDNELSQLKDNLATEHFKEVKSQLTHTGSCKVIGYIGSLRELEGVDFTAKAVAELIKLGYKLKFFVLSSEVGQKELLDLCSQLGISSNSIIEGPVDHQLVKPYYDLIDIFVVSRPYSRVTDIVTPLKPFEAMGVGKTVISSDLIAMKEIIQHQKTGLLYQADNLDSLISQIKWCLDNSKDSDKIGEDAAHWVMNNRTWEQIAEHGKSAYIFR